MKTRLQTVLTFFLALGFWPALAQNPSAAKGPGGLGGVGAVAPGAPQFSATFSKLFGEHKAFSAAMKTEMLQSAGTTMTVPCKVAFLDGQSRMEIDLTQSQGSQIPPGMAQHLKGMGMADMVIISLPAKDLVYIVYPGLQSYAEIASPNGKPLDETKIKVSTTELGKETVERHPCVKNKILITEPDGKPSEAIVWNATDMKKFPLRIDTADENAKIKMTFSQVKFDKPDARLFAPPANHTRYTSIEALMQQALMKSMHGGAMPGMAPK